MGSKKENLFNLLARFKPEYNNNWKALLSAIGDIDDEIMQIIEETKDALLVGSAKGKDLENLASNYNVFKPSGVNMSDELFRKYIPIMAYAPKQILQTLNILLDIFYPPTITSAYIESVYFNHLYLEDGWTLELFIDDSKEEVITFSSSFFNNINEATHEEITVCINSQAAHCYAEVYENFLLNKKCIRIFSKTKGNSSSIKIVSGLAINSFEFSGLIKTEPSIWDIEKHGINIVFIPQNPMTNLLPIKAKDIVLINTNDFKFVGEVHNVTSKSFSIKSNEQMISQISTLSPNSFISFFNSEEVRLSLFSKKVAIWETDENKIEIEIPATTPVYREIRGSGHLHFVSSQILDYKDNELYLKDTHKFPYKGFIRIIPKIKLFQVNEEGISYFGSYNTQNIYYEGKHENKLLNVRISNTTIIKEKITSIKRINRQLVIRVEDIKAFNIGDYIVVKNSDYINGTFKIDEINNNFIICNTGGLDIPDSTNGFVYKEISLLDLKDSICVLSSSVKGSGLIGPFLYDENLPFIITSKTYKIKDKIFAGTYASALNIDSTDLLEDCYIVIDYGKSNQEDLIRCYISQGGIAQLDQSYIFKHNHDIGASFTVIKQCKIPPYGRELGLFATDPSISRKEIQKAIKKIISVGITVEWLIQFRKLVYSLYNIDK